MAKAGSGDTSQLAGSSDETVCMFRVGSFNVDVDQKMRTGKVEYMITTSIQDAGLLFMDLCELDGHCQELLLSLPVVQVRLLGPAESASDGDDGSTAEDGTMGE